MEASTEKNGEEGNHLSHLTPAEGIEDPGISIEDHSPSPSLPRSLPRLLIPPRGRPSGNHPAYPRLSSPATVFRSAFATEVPSALLHHSHFPTGDPEVHSISTSIGAATDALGFFSS